ncbi:MAG: AbrB/MazE/SpoVT family DNA-binding domain-containing protein [Christensenellales bacterium]|jgi:AbrB family looped-hinge helix DNA binding protein
MEMNDKLYGIVKVGEKGQIVIPKDMRDMFNIKPGDTLLALADKERGIAIVKPDDYINFTNEIFKNVKGEKHD